MYVLTAHNAEHNLTRRPSAASCADLVNDARPWLALASDGPLGELRILDFSRMLAGPFATMMMADLGATVTKVERPGTGDETRSWGPPYDEHGMPTYFQSINRNKHSVVARPARAGRPRARARRSRARPT